MKAVAFCCLVSLSLAASLVIAESGAEYIGGVKASFERYAGPAQVSVSGLERYKLRLEVNRHGDSQPLMLRVELPGSGPGAWPAADVEVRDAEGQPMTVRRSGIEWENLLIPLPPDATSCVVQAVQPPGGWPKPASENDRTIQDTASGAQIRIAPWPQGRKAALSIRFDDSHPTHLSKVVPILREFGFKGTFMVNPGPKEPGSRQNYAFETQHAEWEAVMKQGDMELANHSAHHRGAKGDEEMEREIGGAAEAIWKLTPGRSRLMALNLGGGTYWETTRPLRYYLDKYHQFDASSGSLGMDDSYGGRVEAFRKALALHLERGLWCRVHYHYIGAGLSSSEANFRAALDIAKQHRDKLWIAGMADIHKYQTERNASKLTLTESDATSIAFRLGIDTDPTFYDQPLTLELTSPAAWGRGLKVVDDQGSPITAKPVDSGGGVAWRIEVPARRAEFQIKASP